MSMGVYMGMEMPLDGRYTVCVTHDSHGVVHWVFQNQDTLEFLKHGAVTEVPEPHGRLIDADKLKETLDYYISEAGWSDEINKALSWVKDEFIDSEQAIIPASEEDE